MATVEKSNGGSAATADAEDDKNEAAGHEKEATCNSKCTPVRTKPETAVAEEETAAYATASLAHLTSPRLL